MPCPLKAAEPQRGYTGQLLAGLEPHPQSSYTPWNTALPRADAGQHTGARTDGYRTTSMDHSTGVRLYARN